jgi:hypothetical protein
MNTQKKCRIKLMMNITQLSRQHPPWIN